MKQAIQEQLERIHKSVHNGTLDIPTIDDAIHQIAKLADGGAKPKEAPKEAEVEEKPKAKAKHKK